MCLMEEHRLVTLLAKLAPLSCAPSSTEQLTLFPVMLCTSEQTPQRATLSPCGDAAGACEGGGAVGVWLGRAGCGPGRAGTWPWQVRQGHN